MAAQDPTVEDVMAVHEDVVDDYGLRAGTAGPVAEVRLENALADAGGHDPGYERGAFYLRTVARLHVFEDGNKRTAWLVADSYLAGRELEVTPSQQQAATVMRHFRRFSVDELAAWLRTGTIDESELRGSYPD